MKGSSYECDGCGACCVHFNVPVTSEDARKEPKLVEVARYLYPLEMAPDFPSPDGFYLNYYQDDPCPLLDNNGSCSIYATRPNVCEKFEAGSARCQWARGRAGLGLLYPMVNMHGISIVPDIEMTEGKDQIQ